MIGLVLAAGAGRRLRPHTDLLPKALVPIAEDLTILDVILENFAEVGLRDAVIVVGCHGERIVERVPAYEARLGIGVTIVRNDRAEVWNNAYSLWTAREHLAGGAVVVNGDTLHPASVERRLLATDTGDHVLLAVDDVRSLDGEAMKVEVADGVVRRISKRLPFDVLGEYIGVALVPAAVGPALADALERTWLADPHCWYEDALQLLIDEGAVVRPVRLGAVEWTEVDDHDDLVRARELACRY